MTDVQWIEDMDEFHDVIASNSKVVADFTAPGWCRPCQQFAPHFDAAAEASDAIFVAVDVDKAEWAMPEYGIRGVPTVKLFKSGSYAQDIKARTALPLVREVDDA